MIGTLSKAVGSFGAFVAGDSIWIDHLIQHARPYIYTTALPPAIVEATRASLCMIREPSRREKLHENVALFRNVATENGVELLDSQTPIQSVAFGSPTDAVHASERLERQGFLVVAIRPPTVPEGTSRLRITLSAAHETSQIERLVDALVT
jgi:8-amino-7-oxononanoate synthase